MYISGYNVYIDFNLLLWQWWLFVKGYVDPKNVTNIRNVELQRDIQRKYSTYEN